jgi:hypothetical protein
MAQRLSEEIRDFIDTQSKTFEPTSLHLTMLGHSLGGIIARYAIRLILDPLSPLAIVNRYAFPIIPETFMALTSPHLGSRFSTKALDFTGYRTGMMRLGAKYVSTFVERTGRQIHLEDDTLIEMSIHCGPFMQNLRKFKRRILIGQKDDGIVNYHSATILENEALPVLDTNKVTFRIRLDEMSRNEDANDSDTENPYSDAYCGDRLNYSHDPIEYDNFMMVELQKTAFHRIVFDYGALNFATHMLTIGDYGGKPTDDMLRMARETAEFVSDLLFQDLDVFVESL